MEQLITKWGESLNTERVLQEYPRPQMVRNSYINLNGIWHCEIGENCEGKKPIYEGDILVPFSPESYLSGTGKIQIKENDRIIYTKIFKFPMDNKKGRVLLHFGAVDQTAKVLMNGVFVGGHNDGYLPFCCDVTAQIKKVNTLMVIVTDSTEKSGLPRGKQSSNRGGIWYTAQSGIWQSVWIECVTENYIKNVKFESRDNKYVKIIVNTNTTKNDFTAKIYDGEKLIGTAIGQNECEYEIENAKLWTPETPNLYDVIIETSQGDKVKCYFAMRSYGVITDENGFKRFALNGKQYFLKGILDQGYWPDGLYTAPSDEAIIFDIKTAKLLGFNTIRKHIKIEPLRWYSHCDKLGIIVWQDFVNGGDNYNSLVVQLAGFAGANLKDNVYERTSASKKEWRIAYELHLNDTVELLYSVPCIAIYTLFNEGWGQFDALKMEKILRNIDKFHLVDSASGWFDQNGGDFKSLHIYYRKVKFTTDNRILALTEFGGYALRVDNHMFNPQKCFGYKLCKTLIEYKQSYQNLMENEVNANIEKGLSAAIYTQLTDVEDEINGIMTYDRKVIKL
ncbi:MAG: glycoside hydrolase family 2 TIM barrel-domain containing protein [Clostridia bacterium]